MKLSNKQIQHLYHRAGFGLHPCLLNELKDSSVEKVVDRIFDASKEVKPLLMDFSSLEKDKKKLSKTQIKALRKEAKELKLQLNLNWMKQMSRTKTALREKMTFFFHDHFAVNINSPRASLHLNNIMREHALGNFGQLLMEVSKSPAMLSYLNAKQNKKSSPNENFAREVMELFTLGRDNGYTEKDIQAAARAFTGWNFKKDGEFFFQQKNHDEGQKTFLGQTGNFTGEDIIRILLEQRQTAKYLTEKLVDFFVCRKLENEVINALTDKFYTSNYDLSVLMRAILTHDAFLDEKSIGIRIKSPTELLVGITRQFKVEYKNPKVILQIQRALNQALFYPPNVAGWVSGTGWIDSSTLMFRMKLPSLLLNGGRIEWSDEGLTNEEINLMLQKKKDKLQERISQKVQAFPDWTFFNSDIHYVENDLTDFFIQPRLSNAAMQTVSKMNVGSIKDQVIELMSTPEYQLC